MSKEVTVDIVYHETQYTTYRTSIDPDHYEEVMGEPLRGSHPDMIEEFIFKTGRSHRIVDEEADTATAWCVEVDRVEEWNCY